MSKALFKFTSIVSLMTLVSRILGFLRDTIAAQIFGASAGVDAFYVAFKIPNFMRSLFAEGSFSQAFVPILAEYRQTQTHEETLLFISSIGGILGVILSIVTFLGIVGASFLVTIFAPGLDPVRFHLAEIMLRITFPYLMLISLTAFVSSILNAYHNFWVPSLTPAFLNICLIGTAFGITHYFKVPIMAQAYGVLLAGFVQLFFQLPFLYRIGLLRRPAFKWQNSGVQKVLKLILPALFGASVSQLSLLLNTIFASFLITGSVTWLYYSERLAYFPLGVFGVALATVVLPHLSRQFAAKSPQIFSEILNWAIKCNLLIGIPACVFLLVLGEPLIFSLFGYGKFNIHDVFMTERSVLAYSLGLPAFMLIKILASAFYAQRNIRVPVRIAGITLIVNIVLNVIFIFPLAHAGLALATSLSAWGNTALLWFMLRKTKILFTSGNWLSFIVKVLAANFLLAGFLFATKGGIITWQHWAAFQRLEHLFFLGFVGIGIYLGSLWILGMRPLDLKIKSA